MFIIFLAILAPLYLRSPLVLSLDESLPLSIDPAAIPTPNHGTSKEGRGNIWDKTISINLNPYDPIARVAGADIWRRLFATKQQVSPTSALLFPGGSSLIENYFDIMSTTTAPPATTTTTTTTTRRPTPTTTIPSAIQSNPPTVTTTRPSGSNSTVTPTPTPPLSPNMNMNMTTMMMMGASTDELLTCIDLLLDWIHSNSTLNLRKRLTQFPNNKKLQRNHNRMPNH